MKSYPDKAALVVFNEIRNRPYAWTSAQGVEANNCYFKSKELLLALRSLGFTARGRAGETYLEDRVPLKIRELYPQEFTLTHFWVEVAIAEHWHILDASYDPPLARAGFTVNEWDTQNICFPITREFNDSELESLETEYDCSEYSQRYFSAIAPCSLAINEWFQSLRREQ